MTNLMQYHGDALEVLPTLEAGSAQAIVTSPPYYGLRDYGIPPSHWPAVSYAPMAGLPSIEIAPWVGCLGLEPDPLAYIAHLVHVFRLARALLRDDGVLWLNLGDSYANKNLLMIPARAALALQADGWWLRSDVVWEKPNAMPESVTDRPTRAHEAVYLLAKGPRYYYDAAAIAEMAVKGAAGSTFTKGKTAISANMQRPVGQGPRIDRDTRNARTVWSIPTSGIPDAHYAPMPLALADRCIRAATRPGDLVLDPFGGSGTTARAAIALGRRAALIELGEQYIPLQDKRTDGVQLSLEAA